MKFFENSVQRLSDINKKFSSLSYKEILFQSFCADLKTSMGADSALFFLYKTPDDSRPFLEIYPPGFLQDKDSHLALRATNRLLSYIEKIHGRVLTFPEYAVSPFSRFGLPFSESESCVILALKSRKKWLGVFVLTFGAKKKANTDEIRLAWPELSKLAVKLVKDDWKNAGVHFEIVERDTLLKIAQKLSSSLKVEHILEQMVVTLRKVVPFNMAVIFLINQETFQFDYKIAHGFSDAARGRLHLKLNQGVTGWVAKTGKAIIIPNVKKHPRYVEVDSRIKSEVAVPIKIGSRTIGVFTLSSKYLYAFNQNQLKMLQAFASSASIALQNARLYQQTLQKREIDKDLQVAKQIQKALLQRRLPRSNHIQFSAYNKPSKQVGGDLYNVIQLTNGKIALAVGDIAGKGVSGAILMATLQAIYRTEIRRDLPADALVDVVNQQFADSIEVGRFATFFHAVIYPDKNIIEYCSAGHNPAIVLHENGEYDLLDATGIILGLTKEANYLKKNVAFEPGDVLVA